MGAFIGLEFALLMRVIYPIGGNYLSEPAFQSHQPGIQTAVGEDYSLTVLGIGAAGAFLFTVFYLQTCKHKGDFVVASFVLSAVYYATVWLVYQTTSSLMNPAVAISVGFSNMWNHRMQEGNPTGNPLWGWFWIAWIVGPFIGSAIAVPFYSYYNSSIK